MKPKRYKHTRVRQINGDDGYCWAVFVNGKVRVEGLTKAEIPYYRDKFEKQAEEQAKGESK